MRKNCIAAANDWTMLGLCGVTWEILLCSGMPKWRNISIIIVLPSSHSYYWVMIYFSFLFLICDSFVSWLRVKKNCINCARITCYGHTKVVFKEQLICAVRFKWNNIIGLCMLLMAIWILLVHIYTNKQNQSFSEV